MFQDCFILQGRKNICMPLHCLNCGSHATETSQKLWIKSLSVSSVATLGHFDSHTEPWKENCFKKKSPWCCCKAPIAVSMAVSVSIWSQCKRHSIPSLLCVFEIVLQPHTTSSYHHSLLNWSYTWPSLCYKSACLWPTTFFHT